MSPSRFPLQRRPSFVTLSSSLLLILSLSSAEAANHFVPFKSIYAFGDSYTDTGNTESETGPNAFQYVSKPPYGNTFFHHPTNRYSDGRLVIDFVSQALSLPFLPPFLKQKKKNGGGGNGVNFAVAGSTAIVHSFFVKNNMTLDITPQSLQTQLQWFNKLLESKGCTSSTGSDVKDRYCKAVFDDSLIWVGEIGANDYAYSLVSTVPTETIQKLAINSVTNFLQSILSKGAKYVVVQGLPPTGCLTLSMVLAPATDRDEMGCVASANNLSYTHNTILQAKLNDLKKKYPESVIVYADFWNAYRSIVKNPNKFGFKELFKACCGSGGGQYNFDLSGSCGSPDSNSCPKPSQYINWDGVHLTEAMYNVLAASFLNGTFCHPPFSYLLSKRQRSG